MRLHALALALALSGCGGGSDDAAAGRGLRAKVEPMLEAK